MMDAQAARTRSDRLAGALEQFQESCPDLVDAMASLGLTVESTDVQTIVVTSEVLVQSGASTTWRTTEGARVPR